MLSLTGVVVEICSFHGTSHENILAAGVGLLMWMEDDHLPEWIDKFSYDLLVLGFFG